MAPKTNGNRFLGDGSIGLVTGAVVGLLFCFFLDWFRYSVWTPRSIPLGLILGGGCGFFMGMWKGHQFRSWKGAIFGGVWSGIFAPFFFLSVV